MRGQVLAAQGRERKAKLKIDESVRSWCSAGFCMHVCLYVLYADLAHIINQCL